MQAKTQSQKIKKLFHQYENSTPAGRYQSDVYDSDCRDCCFNGADSVLFG